MRLEAFVQLCHNAKPLPSGKPEEKKKYAAGHGDISCRNFSETKVVYFRSMYVYVYIYKGLHVSWMIYRLTAMNMGGACTGFAIPDVAEQRYFERSSLDKGPPNCFTLGDQEAHLILRLCD